MDASLDADICHIPFFGHCDLDDLVSRMIVSGAFSAYFILFDIGIPNLVCGFLLGWWSGPSMPFWVTLEHIFYITANFPQMCLMLDQFLWGHTSH